MCLYKKERLLRLIIFIISISILVKNLEGEEVNTKNTLKKENFEKIKDICSTLGLWSINNFEPRHFKLFGIDSIMSFSHDKNFAELIVDISDKVKFKGEKILMVQPEVFVNENQTTTTMILSQNYYDYAISEGIFDDFISKNKLTSIEVKSQFYKELSDFFEIGNNFCPNIIIHPTATNLKNDEYILRYKIIVSDDIVVLHIMFINGEFKWIIE